MSLVPDTSESTNQRGASSQKRSFESSLLQLPRNVYLLLLFTTGKGFQLSLSALTLNYYVHSLGYQPDFIGVFSAMPAIGPSITAVLGGLFADRLGRRQSFWRPLSLIHSFLRPVLLSPPPFLLSFLLCLKGSF